MAIVAADQCSALDHSLGLLEVRMLSCDQPQQAVPQMELSQRTSRAARLQWRIYSGEQYDERLLSQKKTETFVLARH